MKKNWYVVYTKPECEKKLAALLAKKKIENYCPINRIVINKGNKKRMVNEPLFRSFVFVNSTEKEMSTIRQIGCVINFIYWMAKPAVISETEIESIYHFANNQFNIKLEKSIVNMHGMVRTISDPQIDFNNSSNMLSIKNSVVKMLLPSLGYILIAEIEKSMIDVFNYDVEKSEMLSR